MSENKRQTGTRTYSNNYRNRIKYVLDTIYNECQKKTHMPLYESTKEVKLGTGVARVIIKHFTEKTSIKSRKWIARIPDDEMIEDVIKMVYDYRNQSKIKQALKVQVQHTPVKAVFEMTYTEWCEIFSTLKFNSVKEIEEYITNPDYTHTVNHYNRIPGGLPSDKAALLNQPFKKEQISMTFIDVPEPKVKQPKVVGRDEYGFQAAIQAQLDKIQEMYAKGTFYVPMLSNGKPKEKTLVSSDGIFLPSIIGSNIDTLGVKNSRGTYYYINGIYATKSRLTEKAPLPTPAEIRKDAVKKIVHEIADNLVEKSEQLVITQTQMKQAVPTQTLPKEVSNELPKGSDLDIDKPVLVEQTNVTSKRQYKPRAQKVVEKTVVREYSILWGLFKFKRYGNI